MGRSAVSPQRHLQHPLTPAMLAVLRVLVKQVAGLKPSIAQEAFVMLVVGFVVMTLATVMETEAEVIHMGVALQVVILQRVSLQGMIPLRVAPPAVP